MELANQRAEFPSRPIDNASQSNSGKPVYPTGDELRSQVLERVVLD
jgi:hypothetical protein